QRATASTHPDASRDARNFPCHINLRGVHGFPIGFAPALSAVFQDPDRSPPEMHLQEESLPAWRWMQRGGIGKVVLLAGLEPARPRGQQILSPGIFRAL